MTRVLNGIELFCGCGGISTGFLDFGVRIAAGFDIDRRAVEAYDYNHAYRGSRGFVADLSRTTGPDLLKRAKIESAGLLVGGPPCQPFSIAGARRGVDDVRSNLIGDFLRLAKELRPQAIFFENVPNLAAMDGGRHLNLLYDGLRRLGYSVLVETVACADYGVPQVRRRLVLIAVHGPHKLLLPPPTHAPPDSAGVTLRPWVTASQALFDLPPAGDFGECGIHNHEPTMHTPSMLARFGVLRPGSREKKSFHDRLHPDKPSFTLRAGSGNFSPLRPVHYAFDRVITARESARLQGFGDEFIWPDWIPRLQQYRQVGNAVPPALAKAFASMLCEIVGWKPNAREFAGDPASRANPITLTDGERLALRKQRIRGASLGKNSEARRETAVAVR